MSTVQIQNDIIDDFKILDGDLEMTLNYLMELGESLNVLDEKYKRYCFSWWTGNKTLPCYYS